MIDRFALEQEIMKCWNVVDDIEILREAVSNLEIPPQESDFIQNVLLGVEYLYKLRFEKMFSSFEELISRNIV